MPGASQNFQERLAVDEAWVVMKYFSDDEGWGVRTNEVLVKPGSAPVQSRLVFSHKYQNGEGRTNNSVDLLCERELGVHFRPGETYRFELSLTDGFFCTLSCFREEVTSSGGVQDTKCDTFELKAG
ncbi:MAG: hypothetical protein MK135_09985 [Polyangiaceae bacterium]|nr:hypothetical protein [Polyangiaceae bacterium]